MAGLQRAIDAARASRERYRLIQDGIPVAAADGVGALKEIRHYAAVYAQDGPVRIERHSGGKWRAIPLTPTTPEKDG